MEIYRNYMFGIYKHNNMSGAVVQNQLLMTCPFKEKHGK